MTCELFARFRPNPCGGIAKSQQIDEPQLPDVDQDTYKRALVSPLFTLKLYCECSRPHIS